MRRRTTTAPRNKRSLYSRLLRTHYEVLEHLAQAGARLGMGGESDGLGSFALPYDQFKRICNPKQLPQLLGVANVACTGRAEGANKFGCFMSEYVQVLSFLSY